MPVSDFYSPTNELGEDNKEDVEKIDEKVDREAEEIAKDDRAQSTQKETGWRKCHTFTSKI